MQIFINELSLHGQYYSSDQFTEAMKVFYSIFLYLNHLKIGMHKNANVLGNFNAIRGTIFSASLDHFRDKNLRRALANVLFNKTYTSDWNTERKHSPEDVFEYDNENVTNSSMAELAERKLIDNDLIGILINFQKSKFEGETVCISKNKTLQADLYCIVDKISMEGLLKKNKWIHEYDFSSTKPPLDSETVLSDKGSFQITNQEFQGRKIYKDIQTGHFLYVDNLHSGNAAHLEVFNSEGIHIGEATLDGNIDRSKADKVKKLKF
ncbi:MAG: hypothetical protein ACM3SY_01420 [Candidatus Omnitrophota bacterium]